MFFFSSEHRRRKSDGKFVRFDEASLKLAQSAETETSMAPKTSAADNGNGGGGGMIVQKTDKKWKHIHILLTVLNTCLKPFKLGPFLATSSRIAHQKLT
jgi:hypothetical protein